MTIQVLLSQLKETIKQAEIKQQITVAQQLLDELRGSKLTNNQQLLQNLLQISCQYIEQHKNEKQLIYALKIFDSILIYVDSLRNYQQIIFQVIYYILNYNSQYSEELIYTVIQMIENILNIQSLQTEQLNIYIFVKIIKYFTEYGKIDIGIKNKIENNFIKCCNIIFNLRQTINIESILYYAICCYDSKILVIEIQNQQIKKVDKVIIINMLVNVFDQIDQSFYTNQQFNQLIANILKYNIHNIEDFSKYFSKTAQSPIYQNLFEIDCQQTTILKYTLSVKQIQKVSGIQQFIHQILFLNYQYSLFLKIIKSQTIQSIKTNNNLYDGLNLNFNVSYFYLLQELNNYINNLIIQVNTGQNLQKSILQQNQLIINYIYLVVKELSFDNQQQLISQQTKQELVNLSYQLLIQNQNHIKNKLQDTDYMLLKQTVLHFDVYKSGTQTFDFFDFLFIQNNQQFLCHSDQQLIIENMTIAYYRQLLKYVDISKNFDINEIRKVIFEVNKICIDLFHDYVQLTHIVQEFLNYQYQICIHENNDQTILNYSLNLIKLLLNEDQSKYLMKQTNIQNQQLIQTVFQNIIQIQNKMDLSEEQYIDLFYTSISLLTSLKQCSCCEDFDEFVKQAKSKNDIFTSTFCQLYNLNNEQPHISHKSYQSYLEALVCVSQQQYFQNSYFLQILKNEINSNNCPNVHQLLVCIFSDNFILFLKQNLQQNKLSQTLLDIIQNFITFQIIYYCCNSGYINEQIQNILTNLKENQNLILQQFIEFDFYSLIKLNCDQNNISMYTTNFCYKIIDFILEHNIKSSQAEKLVGFTLQQIEKSVFSLNSNQLQLFTSLFKKQIYCQLSENQQQQMMQLIFEVICYFFDNQFENPISEHDIILLYQTVLFDNGNNILIQQILNQYHQLVNNLILQQTRGDENQTNYEKFVKRLFFMYKVLTVDINSISTSYKGIIQDYLKTCCVQIGEKLMLFNLQSNNQNMLKSFYKYCEMVKQLIEYMVNIDHIDVCIDQVMQLLHLVKYLCNLSSQQSKFNIIQRLTTLLIHALQNKSIADTIDNDQQTYEVIMQHFKIITKCVQQDLQTPNQQNNQYVQLKIGLISQIWQYVSTLQQIIEKQIDKIDYVTNYIELNICFISNYDVICSDIADSIDFHKQVFTQKPNNFQYVLLFFNFVERLFEEQYIHSNFEVFKQIIDKLLILQNQENKIFTATLLNFFNQKIAQNSVFSAQFMQHIIDQLTIKLLQSNQNHQQLLFLSILKFVCKDQKFELQGQTNQFQEQITLYIQNCTQVDNHVLFLQLQPNDQGIFQLITQLFAIQLENDEIFRTCIDVTQNNYIDQNILIIQNDMYLEFYQFEQSVYYEYITLKIIKILNSQNINDNEKFLTELLKNNTKHNSIFDKVVVNYIQQLQNDEIKQRLTDFIEKQNITDLLKQIRG